MRFLLLSTTSLVMVASPLHAQSTVSTANAVPVKTSSIKAGQPDDIVISSTGSITSNVPVSVLIDSDHKVTNQGTLSMVGRSNASAILANAGVTSTIVNSGKIVLDENYTATDSDKDGDLDGPLAQGSQRYGIRTLGAFTGAITQSGSIVIEGNQSAGVLLGGPLTGKLVHDGTTSITGNDSLGVGFQSVSGDVRMAGMISAVGAGSSAVRASGDIGGALVLQGAFSATGYRSTSVPVDQSKLDADDLLQGGPTVSVEGNVAKGIVVAIAPENKSETDKDEDDDGIEDAREGNAMLVSNGASAALRIGAADRDITIGSVPGAVGGTGLLVEGSVMGTGLYAGVDGNAIQIGGLGGDVAIAGGIALGKKARVGARSADRAATAIALREGASTPRLANAGTIQAESNGKTATATATAVLVDEGASLERLSNSGIIAAKVATGTGAATAIVDRSGTLREIVNQGRITADGSTAAHGNVAIDLSARDAGAVVRQATVAADVAAPLIRGEIRLGSGNDLVDIADGTQDGDILFGAGANTYRLSGDALGRGRMSFGAGSDAVLLSGTSRFEGTLDMGGGSDTLAIADGAVFSGRILNAGGLAVDVAKGTLEVDRIASIASLTVRQGGTIGVLLDRNAAEATRIEVAGTATFEAGSRLLLSVADVAEAEGVFTVLRAGEIVGGGQLSAVTTLLPFFYEGTLAVADDEVVVTVTRRTAAELGLGEVEGAAFDAVYEAIGTDTAIGGTFLGVSGEDDLRATYRQMLPDHAGGVFEAITMGERTAARLLDDRSVPYVRTATSGYWLGQLGFGAGKRLGETAGYDVDGWGVTGGGEFDTGLGWLGGSLTYLWGDNDDRATQNGLMTQQYGVAAHWRTEVGGLEASVRGGWSYVDLESRRYFRSDLSGVAVERAMEADWGGSLLSGSAHLSYRLAAGRFHVRPSLDLDHHRLTEKAHQETGGGSALDLTVDARKSDETAATLLLATGYRSGGQTEGDGFFAVELEGGRRELISGTLGATTARFGEGDPFTLVPEQRRSGWLGRLRLTAGGAGLRVGGELGAEEREERLSYSARLGLSFGF